VSQPPAPTLRQRLLRTVLLPLAITWIAGTVVSFAVAQFFSQRAFDRSLLDDAYLLATHVRLKDGRLQLALTPHEVNTVLFDQAETMYFSVRGADGACWRASPTCARRPSSGRRLPLRRHRLRRQGAARRHAAQRSRRPAST
jgi:two-component system sensor histidine kinase TctE